MSNGVSDTGTEAAAMGVAYDTQLALRWTTEPRPVTDARLAALSRQVESVLHAVTGLDDARAPVAEDPSQAGQALVRVEFKLNLLLELVSDLVSRSQQRPPLCEVSIGARQVRWIEKPGETPEVGATGTLDLYLHSLYPYPLKLPGRVTAVRPSGESVAVDMHISSLEPMAQEVLERWIFLHHRRAVAQARPEKM